MSLIAIQGGQSFNQANHQFNSSAFQQSAQCYSGLGYSAPWSFTMLPNYREMIADDIGLPRPYFWLGGEA